MPRVESRTANVLTVLPTSLVRVNGILSLLSTENVQYLADWLVGNEFFPIGNSAEWCFCFTVRDLRSDVFYLVVRS